MQYDDLIRDARNEELMPSTRVYAVFNAISTCWQSPEALMQPPTALPERIERSDAGLVRQLARWAMQEAPQGELPMTPDVAVALAERVHKALGAKYDAAWR
ncbi:hypothetical protein [Paraburkholderia sp. BR13444]|uniref:hypothetical protein n=1 Tax=Paraburkholderia sp. BR13444 TaxID=3236997 RepID=UPI0034CD788F